MHHKNCALVIGRLRRFHRRWPRLLFRLSFVNLPDVVVRPSVRLDLAIEGGRVMVNLRCFPQASRSKKRDGARLGIALLRPASPQGLGRQSARPLPREADLYGIRLLRPADPDGSRRGIPTRSRPPLASFRLRRSLRREAPRYRRGMADARQERTDHETNLTDAPACP
jgi:hypothetical protein